MVGRDRGQADPVEAVITLFIVVVALLAALVVLDALVTAAPITGQLSGTDDQLVGGFADAVGLAVGGTGLAVTAILILRARAGV